jgi:hypothetical protein
MTEDVPFPSDRADGSPSRAAALSDLVGPARDFSAFCELERERRRNSDEDFDPGRFDEALALVVAKLGGAAT